MADSNKIATGSSDDLNVDASRCLRMRFSESSCRSCAEICPHSAVSPDECIAINPNHCHGCLLCSSVCPVGALEPASDFKTSLTQLSRFAQPVLGCIRTKEISNASVACLGGLSDEHLLTLCHSLSTELTINLSLCLECANNSMLPFLHQRLTLLSSSGLLDGGCSIVLAEAAEQIHYRDEFVDRRSFLKSLRNSLLQSTAAVLSPGSHQNLHETGYADKRLPLRRELLIQIRGKLPAETEGRTRKYFDSRAIFKSNCTNCQGCVAVCPTGALRTDSQDKPPRFNQQSCTGCGLCAEFCMDGALRHEKPDSLLRFNQPDVS